MLHQRIAEHRFFFALQLPIQLARQIAHTPYWFGREVRAVAADRLHVTLFILADQFERSPTLIERLQAVGAAVMAAPVAMLLDYVSAGEWSIALRPQHRIAALAMLRQELVALCRAEGIAERPNYTFSPHVTLGYRHGRPSGERVTPIEWTAAEFVLIHSHLGRTKHTVLGRWPLSGGQLSLF